MSAYLVPKGTAVEQFDTEQRGWVIDNDGPWRVVVHWDDGQILPYDIEDVIFP